VDRDWILRRPAFSRVPISSLCFLLYDFPLLWHYWSALTIQISSVCCFLFPPTDFFMAPCQDFGPPLSRRSSPQNRLVFLLFDLQDLAEALPRGEASASTVPQRVLVLSRLLTGVLLLCGAPALRGLSLSFDCFPVRASFLLSFDRFILVRRFLFFSRQSSPRVLADDQWSTILFPRL